MSPNFYVLSPSYPRCAYFRSFTRFIVFGEFFKCGCVGDCVLGVRGMPVLMSVDCTHPVSESNGRASPRNHNNLSKNFNFLIQ